MTVIPPYIPIFNLFVKLKRAQEEDSLPPVLTNVEWFKNAIKKRPGTIAPCFIEMAVVTNDFFLLFSINVTHITQKQ